MEHVSAGWSKFKGFSKEQRVIFHGILKMDPEKTNQFIDLIELEIPNYQIETATIIDSPPESAEQSRALLQKISKYSKDLYLLLYDIEGEISEAKLESIMWREPNNTFDIYSLRDGLLQLAAYSNSAADLDSARNPGRPPDFADYRFINSCVQYFIRVFGKMPKYTKGTKFQKFLKTVSREVCRPECQLNGNITKRIDAALSHFQSKG